MINEKKNNNIGYPDYSNMIEYLTNSSKQYRTFAEQFNNLIINANKPAIIGLAGELQRIFSSISDIKSNLPKIENLISTSLINELSRQSTLALTELSTKAVINQISPLAMSNINSWYNAFFTKSSMLASDYASNVLDLNKSLSMVSELSKISALAVQSSIYKAIELTSLGEMALSSINNDNIGNRLLLDFDNKRALTSTLYEFSKSYSELFESFRLMPNTYIELNPYLTKIAPIEYYSNASILKTITIDEFDSPYEESIKNDIQYEGEISLNNYLPKIDKGLYKLWQGAVDSYNSDNKDKIRHFSVSLRELFTHVLHKLAPNEELKNWSNDPTHFSNGNPTRKARLLYICRNVSSKNFKNFVDKDIDSIIEIFNITQKGTHGIDPNFTPNELITIKSKFEHTLIFLLEIHFKTNI